MSNTITLSYRKLIEIIGWFKRWIYENGDKESVLTLRMPTIHETLDFLFFVMMSVMICTMISEMFKLWMWKDKKHGKSYKIEAGEKKLSVKNFRQIVLCFCNRHSLLLKNMPLPHYSHSQSEIDVKTL